MTSQVPIQPGAVIEIVIDKPAAGGRMLARHEGQVVLVWGAIPGERVRARIERVGKGVLYAETAEVVSASADRRAAAMDWRCGGSVFAHVAYPRQVALKGEIIQDALGRIGRVPLAAPPAVMASPEHGYRMRARLHARDGRIGFFREGTHELCDAASTGQLLPATNAWIASAQAVLAGERGLEAIEIAENVAGRPARRSSRLARTDRPGAVRQARGGRAADRPFRAARRSPGAGASRRRALRDRRAPGRGRACGVSGGPGRTRAAIAARRARVLPGESLSPRDLARHVVALVPPGPVVDLYAGVGLFGLSLAAAGAERVTLVEGDPVSGADLEANARPFAARALVEHRSVETYLRAVAPPSTATFIVDPPRTGMSKDAVAGIIGRRPSRIVYVSCDVATLARDSRALLDAGYELDGLTGFDLFPNTAHVESVAVFARSGA